MSLALDLSPDHLKKLSNLIEQDKSYKSIQNKMRASVLLCTQELMNNTKDSGFDKFSLNLPDSPHIKLAVAIAADYLKQKNLLHTLSVLKDEVRNDDLKEGEDEMNKALADAAGENALEKLISKTK